MCYHHQSIQLAEKRLFPLNYTPKRPQSLKKIDFVPVADFSSQEVPPLPWIPSLSAFLAHRGAEAMATSYYCMFYRKTNSVILPVPVPVPDPCKLHLTPCMLFIAPARG